MKKLLTLILLTVSINAFSQTTPQGCPEETFFKKDYQRYNGDSTKVFRTYQHGLHVYLFTSRDISAGWYDLKRELKESKIISTADYCGLTKTILFTLTSAGAKGDLHRYLSNRLK